MKIVFSTDHKISGGTQENMLDAYVIDAPVDSGSIVGQVTEKDLIMDEYNSSGTASGYEIIVGLPDERLSMHSSNEAVCTIDGKTIVYQGNGITSVTVKADGYSAQSIPVTMTSTTKQTYAPKAFDAGSLADYLLTTITDMLSGLVVSAETTKYLLSNAASHINPDAVRNPKLFCAAYDFSGMSITVSGRSSDIFPPSLVSPRHALIAKHVQPKVGDLITFKRTDGNYQTQTITHVNAIYKAGEIILPDLSLIAFDADITGCAIYETMPYLWEQTYTGISTTRLSISAIPSLRKAMHNSIGQRVTSIQVTPIIRYGTSFVAIKKLVNYYMQLSNPIVAQFKDWGAVETIGGDSGGATFFPVNNKLVLISTQHTTQDTINISDYTTEIETKMNEQMGVVGVYALAHPNLSAFNTY